MKNHANQLAKKFLIVFCATLYQNVQGAPCPGPTVLWHNLSDGVGFSSGVLTDVVDQNIDVIGTNALVDGISVRANTCDIVVTITNGDAVITGSGNRADGVPTNPARLYLFAPVGRSITFEVENDLLFRGTANGANQLDLLVTASGGGTINFFIKGDQHLTFSSLPTSGGTKFFIAQQNGSIPTVLFSRFQPLGTFGPAELGQNAEVQIGAKSYLTFMAETPVAGGATELGIVAFDPSNTGTGYFILRIDDQACMNIMGHLVTAPGGLNQPNFMITDVALAIPAGEEATMQIRNANSGTGTPSLLTIINSNLTLTNYLQDPFCDGSFAVTGTQTGFVLSANGELVLENLTYLNYIGTSINKVPQVFTPLTAVQTRIQLAIANGDATGVEDFIKLRNPSAFVVDGNQNALAIPAAILFGSPSAIYLRSGCNNLGEFEESFTIGGDTILSFTVNPDEMTPGVGNLVLDIEGQLEINGPIGGGNSGLNVLSLAVTPTGCSVFAESTETQFPQRTFARDVNDALLRYNSGGVIVNNLMTFNNTSLMHTDENHIILERDNLGSTPINSEPTYVGGETFEVCLPVEQPRPTMAFVNSFIRFNTGAGFTGVDLFIPNEIDGNASTFRFYGNGRLIDNAYGRYVILGTNEGSLSNGGQLISKDSHLDIFQLTAQIDPSVHQLSLDVSSNSSCITEGISTPTAIANQFSVHTIYLGNESNISIGTDGDTGPDGITLVTTPSVLIVGDYFSFETHGGFLGLPETSGTTGSGGIFVDKNGTITIDRLAIANFSTMVVRSRNGVIDLPENQVNFRNRVGITQWKIDLTQPGQRVLIPASQDLSDFTMDWGAVTKDYVGSNSFVPFEPVFTPSACFCPPVTRANLQALPSVEGTVNQFQIKRSRIGDQAHLLVNGGNIRELVFLLGCNTAEAPVGFIVLQNSGRVGLSTAHRNVDSVSASVVLGINGVTLCANGSGTVEVNEDIIINNVCHILPGPDFAANGPQKLIFHSDDPKELRILNTGVLDLSGFTNPNQIIEFAGQIQVVFEPGARLIMGGGTIIFTDNSSVSLERVLNAADEIGASVSDLDPIRVKISGSGNIILNESAQWLVHANTYLGIENDISCTTITTINMTLNDQARFEVGNDEEPGGVFQVGNTILQGEAVNFNLSIDGIGAVFQINRQGFVGFGVGMVARPSGIPNEWTVGCLATVGNVIINVNEGTFRHNQIFSGNFDLASLLAVGPGASFTFNFDPIVSNILGGGNMIQMQNCISIEDRISDFVQEFIPADIIITSTEQQGIQLAEKAQTVLSQILGAEQGSIVVPVDQVRPLILALLETLLKTNQPQAISDDEIMRGRELIDSYCSSRSGFASLDQSQLVDLRTLLRAPSLGVQLTPTVTGFSGVVNSSLTVGLFSSKDLLNDASQPPQPTAVTSTALFNYLVTRNHVSYSSPKSNAAFTDLNVLSLGYVINNAIIRTPYTRFLSGVSADPFAYNYIAASGAANINIDNGTGNINNVVAIRGS